VITKEAPMSDLADIARQLITANVYLALGTADPSGNPWVSPVFYTPDGYSDFYWVSSPDTQHSHNIAARPEVSLVIFDSHAPVGAAEAVYVRATAAQVRAEDVEHVAVVFNSRLPEPERIGVDEFRAPGPFRLYHATAVEHSVLIRGRDPRNERGTDARMIVTLGGTA
jgi:nitroimidazol reductase NimA-like FMN-containing flavoprotein (pyridoxamine 5'-phosphate oxidase superfamily)